MRIQFSTFMAMAFAAAAGSPAAAAITTFTDRASWDAAVGDYTTIGFNEVPAATILTTQYSHLGVTFVGGDDMTWFLPGGFPNDDYGVTGKGGWWGSDIRIRFDAPQHWIAVDFPGGVILSLYRNSQMIGWTEFFTGQIGSFGGLISGVAFDEVSIWDSDNAVYIDDLHWGVPAPGALAVFGLAALFGGARQRRAG